MDGWMDGPAAHAHTKPKNQHTYPTHAAHIHMQEETRARVARTVAAAERSGKSLGEMKWAVWCVFFCVFLEMWGCCRGVCVAAHITIAAAKQSEARVAMDGHE
jgi:hypothetical protein